MPGAEMLGFPFGGTCGNHLVSLKADTDAGDIARANGYKASFEEHCKVAKAEFMRKTFTPLQWGFGRNGFTYERDNEGY